MNMGVQRTKLVGVGAVLAALVIVVLAGCTAEPAPTASPSPSASASAATPTATPTPTTAPDALTTVRGLVARPLLLELRDSDGAIVRTLDYMSSPAEAIAALSVVFDGPPSDEPYRGTNHTPPGIMHTWDGFVLDERLYDEASRNDGELDYVWPRFAVYFDTPAARDVVLSTEQGLQAGDSWESAAEAEIVRPDGWTCIGTAVEVADVPGSSVGRAMSVVAVQSDDGSTIKWVGGPENIADGCA